MRYAKIREMDISNGKELGVSLFVQGCPIRCKGCFNQETWDFDGGQEWDQEIEDTFFNLIDRPFIKRVSILGGEPLCKQNKEDVLALIARIRKTFPEIKVWLYTGYKLESFDDLKDVDYVVDGPFEIDKQDLAHHKIKFAGSWNQRVTKVSDVLKK